MAIETLGSSHFFVPVPSGGSQSDCSAIRGCYQPLGLPELSVSHFFLCDNLFLGWDFFFLDCNQRTFQLESVYQQGKPATSNSYRKNGIRRFLFFHVREQANICSRNISVLTKFWHIYDVYVKLEDEC